MKSHDNSDFLDGILADIADFTEPDGATGGNQAGRTPGKYVLKTPFWKHVDTLFLLYTWKEQHEVEEKKMEKLGAEKDTFVLYRNFREVEGHVIPCYRKGLRSVPKDANCFCIIFVLLVQIFQMPLEKVTHRALHLGLLLLQRFLMLVDRDE